MRCVCVDSRGVSDLPVRLLIAAVLTSLVVPVFWSAYSDLSATITEGALESELQKLVHAVRDVMSGGVGSRLEVTLEPDGWGNCDIERIEVGGSGRAGSSDCYLVRYDIAGRAQRRLAPEPLTRMMTAEGGPLILTEGKYVVEVSHVMEMGEHLAVLTLND